MKAVVIGAGIGGLALANLLAKAGYQVSMYEQAPAAGGRAGQLRHQGFSFDTGPSWYLMPSVFEHYFDLLDEDYRNWYKLKRLQPAYKVFFENQPPLTISSSLEVDSQTFEAIEAGAGRRLTRYVTAADKIYRLALDNFLYTNFEKPRHLLRADVLTQAGRFAKLASLTLDRYVSGFVKDRRLQQILEYPMVFLGTSPFQAPAIYSLMSALDFKEGVFYPAGGLYKIIEALVTIGRRLGVDYHFNAHVRKILVEDRRATGIELASGQTAKADVVISNADLHFTETQLLCKHNQSYPAKYWSKKQPGPSALLMYLGVKGRLPQLQHHNLLFVDDWRGNFGKLYQGQAIPKPASLYVSKTTASDRSTAPVGHENIFVLVPLPAGVTIRSDRLPHLADSYLQQIEAMTQTKLIDKIVFRQLFGPDDFAADFNAWQSSMLGPSHRLRQSAFWRTPNVSRRVRNLYYVGAGTLPGVGLPMCLISAELVYKRLIGDHRPGRIEKVMRQP